MHRIGIAGLLLVAAFLTPQQQDVFRFANGVWGVVSGQALFSDTPSLGREFAMCSSGVP